jgi:hypothetical protein
VVVEMRPIRTYQGSFARGVLVGLAGLAMFAPACADKPADDADAAVPSASAPAASAKPPDAYAELDKSEELITKLNRRLGGLEQDVFNLAVPAEGGAALFADDVEVQDLAPMTDAAKGDALGPKVRAAKWPIAPAAAKQKRADLKLLDAVVKDARLFEHAHFAFVRGAFQEDGQAFQTDVKFVALADLGDGSIVALKGKLDWLWRRDATRPDGGSAGDEGDRWRIHRWTVKDLDATFAPKALFTDVMERAIPDAATRATAHDSFIERFRLWMVLANKPATRREASDKVLELQKQAPTDTDHGGLAVVDIDDDGLDDLYVMPFAKRAMLLRNKGDGTFEDVAKDRGLDLLGVDSGLFVDIDNDGDKDLVVGGFLDRARYFQNDKGKFKDGTSKLVDGAMPYFVSSIAAADYDKDGLLDVYFSTYAAAPLLMEMASQRTFERIIGMHAASDPPPAPVPAGHVLATWLSDPESRKLYDVAMKDDVHIVLNRPGPPNILFHNQGGGKLARASVPALEIYANTYQSLWTDVDDDGDLDVVVVNDWGHAKLVRNDGDGKFTDASESSGLGQIPNGMGVTAGDYDHDGALDLYVTNMFSKAGQRITRFLGDKAARFAPTAEGNFLYKNDGKGHFTKVSGLEADKLQVQPAGWAWGGQFVDVDNDGYQDLFSVNGYFTAPRQVALPDDL